VFSLIPAFAAAIDNVFSVCFSFISLLICASVIIQSPPVYANFSENN
jgi:hypothetical protein